MQFEWNVHECVVLLVFCEAAVRLKRIGGPLFMRLIQKTGGKQKPAFRFSFENVRRNECGTGCDRPDSGSEQDLSRQSRNGSCAERYRLDIYRGEIFGIIGLSGAGKSTLVRCINFLEKPTEGTVTVDGQELGRLSKKQLLEARRSMGMIFQQFNLLQQRTALQNICFPLEIAGTSKADAEKRARELLEIVGHVRPCG